MNSLPLSESWDGTAVLKTAYTYQMQCKSHALLVWDFLFLTISQLSSVFCEMRCLSWFFLNFMANSGKAVWLFDIFQSHRSYWYFLRYLPALIFKHPRNPVLSKHCACLTWLFQDHLLPIQWLSLVCFQESLAD